MSIIEQLNPAADNSVPAGVRKSLKTRGSRWPPKCNYRERDGYF